MRNTERSNLTCPEMSGAMDAPDRWELIEALEGGSYVTSPRPRVQIIHSSGHRSGVLCSGYCSEFYIRPVLMRGRLRSRIGSMGVLLSGLALLLLAGRSSAQDTSRVDRHSLALQAFQTGDPDGCLRHLDSLSERQRASSRNRWLRLQCLRDGSKANPEDKRMAAAWLVACEQYIRDEAVVVSNKGKVSDARKWREALMKSFRYDGLRFTDMRHEDLPPGQRTVLSGIEGMLTQYSPDRDDFDPLERELQGRLDQLANMDLPMPGGESPVVLCVRKDALGPFKTLRAHPSEGSERSTSTLLLFAVASDAPRITSHLLNEEFGHRDADMEGGLMQAAVEHRSYHVLQQWFNARTDHRIPGLDSWDEHAPRHASTLAMTAFQLGDTAFLRHVMDMGVPPELLGRLVFRALDPVNVDVLEVLMQSDPPVSAKDSMGSSYLHRAMALDAVDAMKLLYHHGWFEKLAGELDADGLPAVHYLATKDLPNLLDYPDLVAQLDMDATDLHGYTVFHKLVFRPADRGIPADRILNAVLKSNPKADRSKPGPNHDWTALHYAARENRP